MTNMVKVNLGFQLDDQETYLADAGSIYTKARTFASTFPGFPVDSYSDFETRDKIQGGRYAFANLTLVVDDIAEAATVEAAVKVALQQMPPLIEGDKGYHFEYVSSEIPE